MFCLEFPLTDFPLLIWNMQVSEKRKAYTATMGFNRYAMLREKLQI